MKQMCILTRSILAISSLALVFTSNGLVSSVRAEESNEDFTKLAKEVITTQVQLIEPLALANRTQDAAFVRHLRNKLILHLGQVDRLLRRYPVQGECVPLKNNNLYTHEVNFNISALATIASGQADALKAYCGLQQTRTQLLAILKTLAVRSQVLQESGLVLKPVPLVNGKDKPLEPFKDWQWQVGKYPYELYMTRLRYQSQPILETVESDNLSPLKTPVSNYEPPIRAVFPPSGELSTSFLEKGTDIALRSPFRADSYIPRNGMQVYEEILDYRKYETFFKDFRNSGFARLEPNGINESDFKLTPSDNSVVPPVNTIALSNPYLTDPRSLIDYGQALLMQQHSKADEEPEIRQSPLMLALDQGQIIVQGKDLDYGFMQEIGDVPLDELPLEGRINLEKVPADLWQYFWNYQPPTALAAIQSERRLYATEKLSVGDRSLVSQLPIQLERTYLMRAIAYDLPEVVKSPRLSISRDFPYLTIQNSSDVLIAFRPIRTRDGNYTLLYRILKRFPAPKINDLAQYTKIR